MLIDFDAIKDLRQTRPLRRHGSVHAKDLDRRLSHLQADRTFIEADWMECARYGKPWALQMFGEAATKYPPMRGHIAHDAVGSAMRVSMAGMVQGLVSPDKPWYGLLAPERHLNESLRSRRWLEEIRDVSLELLGQGNFYAELVTPFSDKATVGIGALLHWDDTEVGSRFEPVPIGTYWIAHDWKYRVDTFARVFEQTARQAAEQFGLHRLPKQISECLTKPGKNPESRFKIGHLIEPNPARVPGSRRGWERPWREFYWVTKRMAEGDNLVRAEPLPPKSHDDDRVIQDDDGFFELPVHFSRGDREPQSPWPTNWPLVQCLGSVAMLQDLEDGGLELLAKASDPPTRSSKDILVHTGPGENTVDDARTAHEQVSPLFRDIPLPLGELREKAGECVGRIEDAFQVHLWTRLLTDQRSQRATATEVNETVRETLRLLASTYTQESVGFFDPLVERHLANLARQSQDAWDNEQDGVLPLPPKEMRGVPVRIRYSSEVAQILREAGLVPAERHLESMLAVSQVRPDVLDNVDFDAYAHESATRRGAPTSMEVDPQVRDQGRKARARQAQAEAEMAAMQSVAGTAKDLSQTPVGDTTALDALAQEAAQ